MTVRVDQARYHRGTVQPHHPGAGFRRGTHGGGRAERRDPAIAHQHALGAADGRHRDELGILDDELHWHAFLTVARYLEASQLTPGGFPASGVSVTAWMSWPIPAAWPVTQRRSGRGSPRTGTCSCAACCRQSESG